MVRNASDADISVIFRNSFFFPLFTVILSYRVRVRMGLKLGM